MDRAGTSGEVEVSSPVVHEDPGGRRGAPAGVVGRYQMLQGALVALQIGPALILLTLVALISRTTPVFFTSRNLGNVLSQTAVIAVLALGQLLVIAAASTFRSDRRSPSGRWCDRFERVHSTAVVILAEEQ